MTNVSNQNETTEHQVIHKKDGRLHIYVRQDKYKGELKSKTGLEDIILTENRKFLHQEHQILKKLFQF